MATPSVISNVQANLKGTMNSIQSEGLITHIKKRANGTASHGLFLGLKSGLGVSKSGGILSKLKGGSGASGSVSRLFGQLTSANIPFVQKKLQFLSSKFGNAAGAKTPFERTLDILRPQMFEGTSSFGELFHGDLKTDAAGDLYTGGTEVIPPSQNSSSGHFI